MKEPKMLALVEEDYITKKEVALRLNKTCRTIDYWMKRGWIPYYKIGRSVRFKMTEVEAELQRSCRVGAESFALKCQKMRIKKIGNPKSTKCPTKWETKWLREE